MLPVIERRLFSDMKSKFSFKPSIIRNKSLSFLSSFIRYSSNSSTIFSQIGFESYYKIRSNIELLIQDMSKRQLPKLDYDFLMKYKPTCSSNNTKFSVNQRYIMNIQYMNMLLVMTCQQLDLIQKVPYIVLLNPKIELTHSLYLKTLQSLLSFNYPYDLYDQDKMIMIMQQFLNDHEDTLLTLSTGLQEVIDHNSKFDNNINYDSLISNFLHKHLLIRIKMKLIATHYLELMEHQNRSTDSFTNNNNNNKLKQIGILDSEVNLNKLIRHNFDFIIDLCHLQYDPALLPELNITSIYNGKKKENNTDVVVPMIPIIFEYIMTEILKNSVRASIENSMKQKKKLGPLSSRIDVKIHKERKEYSNELIIKISDQGGGIPPSIEPHIFEYSYSTLNNKHIKRKRNNNNNNNNQMEENLNLSGDVQPTNNNIAGMGFGLPLCKLYMELFDGKLDIQSLYGYGTDTYLTIPLPEWHK